MVCSAAIAEVQAVCVERRLLGLSGLSQFSAPTPAMQREQPFGYRQSLVTRFTMQTLGLLRSGYYCFAVLTIMRADDQVTIIMNQQLIERQKAARFIIFSSTAGRSVD